MRQTAQSLIIKALRSGSMTDRNIATATGLPESSVRRTRLHLVAAGTVVSDQGARWRLRAAWEEPDTYEGVQDLAWRFSV